MSIESSVSARKKPLPEKLKKKRLPVEAAKWERRLREEGMPRELPPDAAGIIEESEEATSAVRLYAAERSVNGTVDFTNGEHEKFARAVAQKFDISVDAARGLVQDAFDQADRFFA